ncbi:xanthine dehydrogenase accessory protein XdhC [Defluviimonas sp. D31]|uniref:xanthine dehydrogenase accessory protein XdhC n=1 Tax=Defluviimonas sp. D31 TaxID=3083253 RepID=UPI00296EDEEB|nr:xanthine dehydrogenase accessory protein XdhC [Defluviimonas sp. D31]MDW4549541.1 xanthine dehydrogenase accessory protein XdhC [Defluviimonas sp. D31]
MSVDLQALARRVAAHGAVIRVVVAEVAGSAPREAGAAMLVWAGGQEGTIGGGALEYEAAARARAMLAGGTGDRVDRMPLGPRLNQCCGGAVTLLSELWDAARLREAEGAAVIARPLPGTEGEAPLAVRRILNRARGEGFRPVARILHGWMVEPVAMAEREIWIWGAGHVGRALVAVLGPLPGLRLTWVDTDAARFPNLPEGVVQRVAANPADLVAEAPGHAEHLVLTFSHAIDLELCHRLLGHGFRRLGLIGSATKWARFRSRLKALGHGEEQIGRIRCPIGDPSLGKHPQAIAVGVAAELIRDRAAGRTREERTG